MADTCSVLLFADDFGYSDCALWVSTSKGSHESSPLDQRISGDDLTLTYDETIVGFGNDVHNEQHKTFRMSEKFLDKNNASANVEIIDDLDEYDIEKDFPTDHRLDPLVAYDWDFPNGHELIPTPSTGLLCGFAAAVRSMQAVYPSSACPTVGELQRAFHSPGFVEHATAFGMDNENNFSVDQVAAILYNWGVDRGLNIRLGYVAEGEDPQLVPHPNEDTECIICWIHNDNAGDDFTGALGHFSGMRPRRVDNVLWYRVQDEGADA